MKVFDVIIVGAGPAGCFVAYELCKRGVRDILMLEGAPSLVRHKPCGGQLDDAALKAVPELRKIMVSRTTRHLRYYNNRKLTESGNDTFYYFTRSANRRSLDCYFPTLMRKKGVKVVANRRVTDIDNREKDFATVTCNSWKYFGRLVIDAGGATSPFNHRLAGGKTVDGLAKFVCSVAEFKLSDRDEKTLLDLLENDEAADRSDCFTGDPVGLYWSFYYKNLRTANIGNGFAIRSGQAFDTRAKLAQFLRSAGLKDWDEADIKTWVAPYELQERLYTDHVLWIGDSVGMVNPHSGNGMPNACAAAPILAEVCCKALASGDFSSESLKRYQEHPEMQKYIKDSKRKKAMTNLLTLFGMRGPPALLRWIVKVGEKRYTEEVAERCRRF